MPGYIDSKSKLLGFEYKKLDSADYELCVDFKNKNYMGGTENHYCEKSSLSSSSESSFYSSSSAEKAHIAEMKTKVSEVNTMVQMYIDDNNAKEPPSLKFDGSNWANYGKMPVFGENHIFYEYSQEKSGDGNYIITGIHTGPGSEQDKTFKCTQDGCN